MAVYPFFPADDVGLSAVDALLDASAALSTLSFLIGSRNELNLGAEYTHGLAVMISAVSNVMEAAADEINDMRKTPMADNAAANYERGYQNGLADGRAKAAGAEGAAEPVPRLTEEAPIKGSNQSQASA